MQASYIAAAAYKAWATPRVDLLIQYLYRDEPTTDRWQSGLVSAAGNIEARDRRLRGAARPGEPQGLDDGRVGNDQGGTGARVYRLQRFTTSGWQPVGGVQRTRADGTLQRKRGWRRQAPSCGCSRTASRATPSSFASPRLLQPDETSATETSAHTTPTYWSRESRSRSTKAARITVVTG